jgi:phage terminase small subunit
MLKFCSEFGLTPSSRSRMIAGEVQEGSVDEMEFLLLEGNG